MARNTRKLLKWIRKQPGGNRIYQGDLIIFYGKKYTETVEMNPQTTRWRQNVSRWFNHILWQEIHRNCWNESANNQVETEYIKVSPKLPSWSNSSIGDNPQQEDDIEKIYKWRWKELSENEIAQFAQRTLWKWNCTTLAQRTLWKLNCTTLAQSFLGKTNL